MTRGSAAPGQRQKEKGRQLRRSCITATTHSIGSVIAALQPVVSAAKNVHLMQAARGVAKYIVSLAIEMLVVQYDPVMIGVSGEVVQRPR